MKIKPATIIRTIVLVLALVNQVLTACGRPVINFGADAVTQLVTGACTIAAAAWNWWNNNSITRAAVTADQVLDAIQSGAVTAEDVAALVAKRKGDK